MANKFGVRLKELRQQKGMTQEALARAANLSVSSISKLEQLDLDPSWSTVQALTAALGVDCTAFAGVVAGAPPTKKPGKKK